jgi:hypothetical protein
MKLDGENLEFQLEKIRLVLLEISRNHYFNSFSHFEKLADIVAKTKTAPADTIESLGKWNYESSAFIKTERCGNCNDFAVLCQKMLSDIGVPTTIIGRFPDKKDFTKKQINFLRYRHLCLLYANESNGLKVFTLEPSWKFSEPILINQGATSIYKDWESEILQINEFGFTQRAYSPKKNVYRERLFDIHPLSIDFCRELTKRLIRVPRKLQILSTKNEPVNQFIRLDPIKQTFTTNIGGIDGEFLPNTISLKQSKVIEDTLGHPKLIERLSKVLNFIKSLPTDFWIKD